MKDEIITKINKAAHQFQLTDNPFSQEIIVVYLMVQIRKILGYKRNKTSDFEILKFYADWCVHTTKDYITKEMKNILKNLNEEINWNIQNKTTVEKSKYKILLDEFINMKSLKENIKSLFSAEKIEDDILNKMNWDVFINALMKILQNQPLKNKGEDIRLLRFSPTKDFNFIVNLEFKNKKTNEYELYKVAGVV